ncbi:unnamed protein product [Dibothriocephalus latus]|uniref:Uncharacterized protein n=1 Tax=Dibothriocephalus latus TaxID=60516 RepID=A0A3P6QR17_DIBLA|nr:unnamed protein product [Dibothriocephalus latus]
MWMTPSSSSNGIRCSHLKNVLTASSRTSNSRRRRKRTTSWPSLTFSSVAKVVVEYYWEIIMITSRNEKLS